MTMTVDEAKKVLGIEHDVELARMFKKTQPAVSAWRSAKRIPSRIELAIRERGGSATWSQVTEVPTILSKEQKNALEKLVVKYSCASETTMIVELMGNWEERRRKKLLRYALELDEEEAGNETKKNKKEGFL